MFTNAQTPSLKGLAALLLASFVVAGCQSSGTDPNEAPPAVEPVPQTQEVSEPVREVESQIADFAADGVTPLDANGRPISRTFYFDYDRSVLRPADLAALELHAQILRRNPDRSVVVEGHCDERGTREYNLALGERRAGSVSSFLRSAGVPARQIETVSYGEEQPQDAGHTESAWAKNRRAVVSYR